MCISTQRFVNIKYRPTQKPFLLFHMYEEPLPYVDDVVHGARRKDPGLAGEVRAASQPKPTPTNPKPASAPTKEPKSAPEPKPQASPTPTNPKPTQVAKEIKSAPEPKLAPAEAKNTAEPKPVAEPKPATAEPPVPKEPLAENKSTTAPQKDEVIHQNRARAFCFSRWRIAWSR